jgi:hypothetical protein
MKIMLTLAQHNDFIVECLAGKPDSVFVTTYGIWAGYNFEGKDAVSADKMPFTRKILDGFRAVKDVRMLVSIPSYASCKGLERCLNCESKYVQSLFRLQSHADAFPAFQWRLVTDSHIKAIVFTYKGGHKIAVVGGRNFTNSQWADITFGIGTPAQIAPMEAHAQEMWIKGLPISNDVIGEIIQANEISSQAMEFIAT